MFEDTALNAGCLEKKVEHICFFRCFWDVVDYAAWEALFWLFDFHADNGFGYLHFFYTFFPAFLVRAVYGQSVADLPESRDSGSYCAGFKRGLDFSGYFFPICSFLWD
ncbi:hypothetical protein AVEN_235015-1 [Araneus ventricosus]|uniref:Uncharacterized protein n=1 Tax=Araneus ventricosus TaxID=182803 RepID=A0A4Y2FP93_ARAVE|nr:hypothetical protein AVEN_235015-1 [Araneus ventricosus]